MEVNNDLYDYRLKIIQNTDYFKFSIDSILLGEFTKVHDGQNVLDICTGNIPIPLILSCKNKDIKIDAVEIQKEIYDLGYKSVKINNLDKLITIFNEDIKTFDKAQKYDVITCNPPYFKNTNTSHKNENLIKRTARHEITITLEEIIINAVRLLKENGNFYMVHRTERFLETISLLEKYKLGIRNITFIYTKNDTQAEFFLIECSKSKKSDPKIYSKNVWDLTSFQNLFKE